MSLRKGILHGMLEKEHRQEGFHGKNLSGMGFQRLSAMETASNDDWHLSWDVTDKTR